jgi:nitrite reductase/ring-hydroxylating ferredoxin subunit
MTTRHSYRDEQDHDAQHDAQHDGFGRCPLTVDRRLFLRNAALAALGVLAAGTVPTTLAHAVEGVRPLDESGANAVERLYAVPAADGVSIDDTNEVILVRWQGRAYAFSSRCTHRGARLEWRAGEGRIFCPKHKARFRPDGAHDSGRQTRALDRYDIRRRGDALVIDFGALRRVDTDPAAWAAAVVRLG